MVSPITAFPVSNIGGLLFPFAAVSFALMLFVLLLPNLNPLNSLVPLLLPKDFPSLLMACTFQTKSHI